jgi:hypothetical protein
MSDLPASGPVNVVLTREEMALVARLLDRVWLIGHDPDPAGPLSTEQERTALLAAERSLRARELAGVDDQGQLRIRTDVLNALAIALFADVHLQFVTVTADGARRDRLIVRALGPEAVAQTTPAPALHRFLSLPGRETLPRFLAQAALGTPDLEADDDLAFSAPADRLRAARASADRGDASGVLAALGREPAETAFAHALVAPHQLTVIHVLAPLAGDQVAKQELTVLRTDQAAWLTSQTEGGPDAPYQVRTTSTAGLAALFAAILAPQPREATGP